MISVSPMMAVGGVAVTVSGAPSLVLMEALSEQIGRDVEAAKKLFVSEKKTVYNPKGL